MKQIVCEMCGSNDLLKTDGVYVCQMCGSKYIAEGAQQPKDAADFDPAHTIEFYYQSAENAYNSNLWELVQTYCNKLIDLDPNDHRAWLLLGKLAGKSCLVQTTLREAAIFFMTALQNAPSELVTDLEEEIKTEYFNICESVISHAIDSFVNAPCRNSANRLMQEFSCAIDGAKNFLKCVDARKLCELLEPQMIDAVKQAWSHTILCSYQSSSSIDKWMEFREQCSLCRDILLHAVGTADASAKYNIKRYKLLAEVTTELLNSHAGADGSMSVRIKKEDKKRYIDETIQYHWKIKQLDPNHAIPSGSSLNRYAKLWKKTLLISGIFSILFMIALSQCTAI